MTKWASNESSKLLPSEENAHRKQTQPQWTTESTGQEKSPWLGAVSIVSFAMVMVFTMVPHVGQNGHMVELPLLVSALPEGWTLPSYFTIAHQVGKLLALPILAIFYFTRLKKDVLVIYTVTLTYATIFILYALFWKETNEVADGLHSIAFLTLFVCEAGTDAIASVTFMAYMAGIKAQYMPALFMGATYSGVLVSVLGFIQGVPTQPQANSSCSVNETFPVASNGTEPDDLQQPRFSVSSFWVLEVCLFAVGAGVFTFFHFSSHGHKARKTEAEAKCDFKQRAGIRDEDKDTIELTEDTKDEDKEIKEQTGDVSDDDDNRALSGTAILCIFLHINTIVSQLVIGSLSSYIAMPYGADIYGISTKLGMCVKPLCCFLTLFTGPHITTRALVVLDVILWLLTAYMVYLAALSPHPPLQGQLIGDIHLVIVCMLHSALTSYLVAASGLTLHMAAGRRGMVVCSSLSQPVQIVFSTLLFVMVNVLHLFKSASDCDQ